jgi:NADPH:quinone reductase-like Zn-dependent oxidoreductase
MTMRGMPAYQRARLTAEVELRLLPALAGGRLVPARRTVFGFNQAPQALAHLRTGGEPGRVLLRMGSG